MEDINRIKVVLVEKKRTNKWLAEQLGVNPTTVSKWCTNSSQPDLGILHKIADLLGVDIRKTTCERVQTISAFTDIKGFCTNIVFAISTYLCKKKIRYAYK